MRLSQPLQDWRDRGSYIFLRLSEVSVFYLDIGKPDALPDKTLLILHGFPESSYSFHKVISGLLAAFERIVLFDMPGYGLSDKPITGYTYSLFEQADSALQLWKQLGISGGHLLSHDMGDSVATELVARQVQGLLPAWFTSGFHSYTFTNGSMVLGLAKLRITQKILLSHWGKALSKFSTLGLFNQQVRSAHGNDNLSNQDIELLWENLCLQNGNHKNYLLIKYLNDRKRFETQRWLPALKLTNIPIYLCWGEDDAVARVEMAHYLKKEICPQARLKTMPQTGHFCQIGKPETWVQTIVSNFNE